MRANFFVLFPTAQMPPVPTTYIAAYRAPNQKGFDNALVNRFPNVTNVDMGNTLNQVQRVLGQTAPFVQQLAPGGQNPPLNPPPQPAQRIFPIALYYITNIAIAPLLKDVANKDALDGKGNVTLDVNTAGATVDALKRGLNGSARVELPARFPLFAAADLIPIVQERRPIAVARRQFDPLADRTQLNSAVDRLNQKFGKHTVYLAAIDGAREAAPERIAFNKTWLFSEGKGDQDWVAESD